MTKRSIATVMVLLFVTALAFAGGGQEEVGTGEGRVDLEGESIDMSILGIGGWIPSELGVQMAEDLFVDYAQENFGYDVSFSFQDAPFSSLFQKAATSLAAREQEFNIIVSDSQWLGAFAEPGWIVQLNDIIENSEVFSQLEWYDPVVRKAYMTYPDGSDQLWGLPQEGDVLVLYVRQDMFSDPDEQEAFEDEYGWELPQTFEDWIDVSMDEYEQITEFFTRPDEDLYGMAYQYAREYDFFSMYYYPYLWSTGGRIWDQEDREVTGILNTDNNAESLERMVAAQQWQPSGVNNYGIPQIVDAFTSGRVATAMQWAAMGAGMMPEGGEDDVLIVPPPAFENNGEMTRIYSIGGQPWVLNAYNDAAHMQVALDFLEWWYLPETQLEFARRGGNPAVKSVLESDGFEDIQPWFRAYKYMLTEERARDFWHEPTYAEMLATQQEAFTAYATGQVDSAKRALDYAACEQQRILNEAGRSEIAPPDYCDGLTLE